MQNNPLRRKMNTNRVCGEFPKFCYKAFENKEYAEDFMNRGTFRMGCQLSYRKTEDELRCDPTEGIGLTKEPDLVTVMLQSELDIS
jgi:hypothetical protein